MVHSLFLKYQVPTPTSTGIREFFRAGGNTESLLNEDQLNQLPRDLLDECLHHFNLYLSTKLSLEEESRLKTEEQSIQVIEQLSRARSQYAVGWKAGGRD